MLYHVNGNLPQNLSNSDKQLITQVTSIADDLEKIVSKDDYEELADYLDDVLDVEFKIGGDFRYRGVQIQLAFGGPNIYFDTISGKVEGYWGFGNSFYATVNNATCDAVDDYYENYFETCR